MRWHSSHHNLFSKRDSVCVHVCMFKFMHTNAIVCIDIRKQISYKISWKQMEMRVKIFQMTNLSSSRQWAFPNSEHFLNDTKYVTRLKVLTDWTGVFLVLSQHKISMCLYIIKNGIQNLKTLWLEGIGSFYVTGSYQSYNKD